MRPEDLIIISSITYPHLMIDPDGTTRIGNTQYNVRHLASEHYSHGWSEEELLRQHPDLRPAEVHPALVYFYDHYDEIVAELEASAECADRARTAQPLSRDKLKHRAMQGR